MFSYLSYCVLDNKLSYNHIIFITLTKQHQRRSVCVIGNSESSQAARVNKRGLWFPKKEVYLVWNTKIRAQTAVILMAHLNHDRSFYTLV